MNFLIDEAHLTSKGANAVVSYLHYFLSITAWVRPMSSSTATTAQDKIKIALSCGIVRGEWLPVGTGQSH